MWCFLESFIWNIFWSNFFLAYKYFTKWNVSMNHQHFAFFLVIWSGDSIKCLREFFFWDAIIRHVFLGEVKAQTVSSAHKKNLLVIHIFSRKISFLMCLKDYRIIFNHKVFHEINHIFCVYIYIYIYIFGFDTGGEQRRNTPSIFSA